MKKFFFAAALLAFSAAAFAQSSINTAKIDSLFTVLEDNDKAMASLTLYKNGKVLYSRAIGCAKIDGENRIKANTGTKYRIGSITKMFTSVMILQLVEEGKLKLDGKLSEFYPKVPNADKITLKHMLTHHSGLHNFTDDDDYLSYHTQSKTHEQLLEMFYKLAPDFEPGEKGEYSNTNYVLLGFIIEKVTGKTYAENLKSRITDKAKLKDTYYGGPADITKNEAFSYRHSGKGWEQEPETDMSIPHGAGAIVSTPTDLAKFAEALFGGRLIKPETLALMKTMEGNYGMGMLDFPFYERMAYGHSGGIDGFSSMLGYFPDDSLVIACTSNGSGYPSTNDIMVGVLSSVYNKPYTIPTFTTFALKPESLPAYEGTYSSKSFPLKITIKAEDGILTAQATGQSSFPLEAQSETTFTFLQADITIKFTISSEGKINSFDFEQGGFEAVFEKENK